MLEDLKVRLLNLKSVEAIWYFGLAGIIIFSDILGLDGLVVALLTMAGIVKLGSK